MLFNSIPYIILLPLAALFCRLIPGRFRYVWLLILSYAFYFVQSEGSALWMIVTTVITYLAGLSLGTAGSAALKRVVLALAVTADLGLLFVFKYLDFSLSLIHNPLRFSLLLPLGISFYSFMSVSYLADVFSGKIASEKNPLKLALYVSFFLSIVSGPINRAGDMLPQFTDAPDVSYDMVKSGIQKMLWGYFLKLAIAGRLAILVDNVYADTDAFSGTAVAFAALSYMFMLYCDFEGYSQIAIGSGYLMGITMKENFRQPFFSESMSEIWRRWHVSLSTWFRDYLYIPLGGSRKGKIRKYVNLLIVLFISGIWHGANLTFFAWGAINGAFIVMGQILLPYRDALAGTIKEKICKNERAVTVFDTVRTALKRIGVYILFSYVFIYFASDDIKSAYLAVKAILTRFTLGGIFTEAASLGLGTFNLCLTIVMSAFVLIADKQAYKRGCDTPSLVRSIPTPVRWAIYYALFIAILFSANLTGREFIYSKM